MGKANFHTHTSLCHHAKGSVDDYCREAIKAGISVLGFTDHCPFPDGRWASARMDMSELPGYVRAIEQARSDYPQLTILAGLECEYVPEFADFQRECFLGEFSLDYLIGAAHSYRHQGEYKEIYGETLSAEQLQAYADYLVEIMNSGLYSALAHPDLFAMTIWEWNKDAEACARKILEQAARCRMPLEINAYGLRKPKKEYAEGIRSMYPITQFWQLAAEYDIEVLPGSDAHRPEDVWSNTDDCFAIAERFGLKVINDEFLTRVRKSRHQRNPEKR
jgi:histidinol-phosphatase (PHP family)